MPRVRLRTNAKVNLFLRVLGERLDGYHEVETVLHGVGLADDIEITSTTGGAVEIDMSFSGSSRVQLPKVEENVIWEVAQGLIRRGALNQGIAIKVVKRIPIGAGLGGGSGNAAGALVALNELWEMGMAPADLEELAAAIGSDVPYCLNGGTALATSRGEALTALPAPADMWFVLGISHEPLLTRDVYARWRPGAIEREVRSAPMTLALGGEDVAEVAYLLHNDLEPAVFEMRPELEEKKGLLLEAGALGALVSGSGPTLFAVASDEIRARDIEDKVAGTFDQTVVVPSQPNCIERVTESEPHVG
ncbi:MAG: 4-(cytidine 5'-diphospho)-2-C-methyl-D-erythritol kinase [Actinomycetota bacterium]|nr:4-(cytidine 5'-diphospho)-2-C-methyl-D-erythritol kinase [Actinomycetota bacterium]